MFGGSGNIADKVWGELMKEVDDNEDGQVKTIFFPSYLNLIFSPFSLFQISFVEFKKMMLSLMDKAEDEIKTSN